MPASLLRLRAEDQADLDVLSAACQDGVVHVSDMAFDSKARRFSVSMARFRWERAGKRGPYERIRAHLVFEGVLGVRSRRFNLGDGAAVASLMTVHFDADPTPPGGYVRLVFAGDGEIALAVECLDAMLLDEGAPWATPNRPNHASS